MFFVAASRTHFGGKSKPPCWFFLIFFNLIKEVSHFLFSYIPNSLLFTSLRYLSSNLLITSLGCSFSFISSLYSFCLTYTRGMAGGWKYLLINVKKSNY